jgi:type IV pilus assembly protein PilO
MNPFVVKFGSMEMSKVFFIAAILGFFYYFKVFNDGSEIEARISSLQQELSLESSKKQETQKALGEVERMRKAVGELGNRYQDLIRQLPTELTSLEINRSIDEFSRDSGINIVSRQPENGISNEIFVEELVTIEAESDYSKLAQFIYFLSRSERLIAIKNFNIRRASESDDNSNLLKFRGTVINYRLAPEKQKSDKSASAGGGKR